MLVFGTLLGAAAFILTTRLAYANLEEAVQTRAREVRAQVGDLTGSLTDLPATEVASPVVVQVVADDGMVLAQSPGLPTDTRLCNRPGEYLTVERTARADSGEVTICAAASLKPVERVQAGVLVALSIMLPVALVGVGVAVWFTVGRALRSVEDLRRQAETMTEAENGILAVQPTGDEVERLGRTLNDLIKSLHAQTRATQQFVADAGHELRNPLATLRVALEFDDGSPEGRALALAELTRLEGLVSDLLVLARSDAREAPTPVPVDLAELIRGSIAARRAVRPDVAFDVELVPMSVVADVRAMRGAIDNLIANAARHAVSKVTVAVERRGDECVLRVDDDGLGLAPRDCERVFDRFVRLDDARDRDEGGSGLGLAIVAAVAAAHGGRAWAEPGPGGHFRLALPVA